MVAMSKYLYLINKRPARSPGRAVSPVSAATAAAAIDDDDYMATMPFLQTSTTTTSSSKTETSSASSTTASTCGGGGGITRMGLFVLMLLAIQNCSKNLVVGQIMKNQPQFLTSTAVLSSECLKLTLSVLYILFIQKQSFASIIHYLHKHSRKMIMLIIPAAAYNMQASLEYVALANLNAAVFSVIVQTKLVFTAIFALLVLGKKLRKQQVISLVLLTIGVMLCNMRSSSGNKTAASAAAAATAATVDDEETTTLASMLLLNQQADAEAYTRQIKGIMATLGIAITSGFASVYTEKFIKGNNSNSTSSQTSSSSSSSSLSNGITTTNTAVLAPAYITSSTCKERKIEEAGGGQQAEVVSATTTVAIDDNKNDDSSYGLAYTQVQLAFMSSCTIGFYALMTDWQVIVKHGLFVNFSMGAIISICMSACGGLIVASVLKYADSILKGYATALSVILTGVLSMILFHTHLAFVYFAGIGFVVAAVILYNL